MPERLARLRAIGLNLQQDDGDVAELALLLDVHFAADILEILL